MLFKIVDDFVECDRIFGPMPDVGSSFEAYFIEKAYSLLFESACNSNEIKYLVNVKETKN